MESKLIASKDGIEIFINKEIVKGPYNTWYEMEVSNPEWCTYANVSGTPKLKKQPMDKKMLARILFAGQWVNDFNGDSLLSTIMGDLDSYVFKYHYSSLRVEERNLILDGKSLTFDSRQFEVKSSVILDSSQGKTTRYKLGLKNGRFIFKVKGFGCIR